MNYMRQVIPPKQPDKPKKPWTLAEMLDDAEVIKKLAGLNTHGNTGTKAKTRTQYQTKELMDNILAALRTGEKTTVDLVHILGKPSHTFYYALMLLDEAGSINKEKASGRYTFSISGGE